MHTCSSCGRGNPDDARFCASCGSPLRTADPHEARKTVTVLFADVVGSTDLGEQVDPETLRRVMAGYFETARSCLERHGASVEKFIGDAVMAVFGVPTIHEDDALRAVRAAADLRTAVSNLNVEFEASYGISLRLRIGVNTGEVVVGTEERLATGDAVNVAARLEQAAGPDEILLGEETFRLTRGAIEVDPATEQLLKGKAQPVRAFPLRRVVEGAAPFERRFDTPLVGRSDELKRVRSVFEQVVEQRRCHLITVLGPPGIGKSRFAREVAANLGNDALVLTGRCLSYGEGITFWPLREIFAAAGAEIELDAALADTTAEQVFWAVRKLLERLARERPLVLVFEDIHWAEPTLLDLITYLGEWTRDARLTILCLARPELLDTRPAWAAAANSEILTLQPLGGDESEQLISGLLGSTPLEEPMRARIREVADGNPLFVEQLVANLAEGGRLDDIPPTIQALIAARLDTLAPAERDVLEAASVVGFEFEWDALGRLDPEGRRPSGAVLSALARKELIRLDESTQDSFRFGHVLIKDAAYERIPKLRRADLHERVADWLDSRTGEFDEIVGYHLEQAHRSLIELGRPGERGRTLAVKGADRLGSSGLRANARGDTEGATNLLGRAVALLPADEPRRLALLPVLGRALREAGRIESADEILAEAVERAGAAGEPGIAADAAVTLADLRFHRPAQTGVGRQDVLDQIDAAVLVFEERGDEAGLGRALSLGGRLRFWGGQAAAATGEFERAARHSRDAADWAEEAVSLNYILSTLLNGPASVDEALRKAGELRPRAELNRRLQINLLATTAQLEAMRGRFARARSLVEQGRTSGLEHGLHVLLDAGIRRAAGYIELLAGDPEAAELELRAACEGLDRVGELGTLSSVVPLLIDTLFAQGRDDEALVLTARWQVDRLTVPEDADAQAGWRRVRAKLLARAGEDEEALRLGHEAVAIASRTDFTEARAWAAQDLSVVLGFAGRPVEAEEASAEAIRLFEEKGNTVAAGRIRARLG